MINNGDSKRWIEEPLYRFFTTQIYKVEREIEVNREQIKKLSENQTTLKRGKAELVRLRRELDKNNRTR